MTEDPYYGLESKEAYVNALQSWADYLNESHMEAVSAVIDESTSAMLGDMDTWYPTGILNQVTTEQDREAVRLMNSLLNALYNNGFYVDGQGKVHRVQ